MFEFESSPVRRWADVSYFAAKPRPKRYFVDQGEDGHALGLGCDDDCGGRSKLGERIYELGPPYVNVIRPTIMAKIPGDLHSGFLGRPRHRNHARPVILSRSWLY